MDETDDTPAAKDHGRRPWREGPAHDRPRESWLDLDDDELLHRIETLDPGVNADRDLVKVVRSRRHFFIRQEAAKKIRDRSLLFPFENDRHVGQILVRYLTRREDVTYLERLVASSHHVEVRAAAQVQLAQLWGRLGGPRKVSEIEEGAPPAPHFEASLAPREEVEVIEVEADPEGIDGTLLAWAIHFLVEKIWTHLGTRTARDLLLRTHTGLLSTRPVLSFFAVEPNAQVNVDLSLGATLPREAVAGVASWMMAFLDAARRMEPEVGVVDVRQATHLMADALDQVGFYAACEGLESHGAGRY